MVSVTPMAMALNLVICMISAIAVCGLSTGDMCKTSDTGKFGVAVRDKNGIFRCCEDKSCLPGTYPRICNNVSSTSSSCEPCPDGEYRDKPSKTRDGTQAQCRSKKECPSMKGLTVVSNGSSQANRVCRCRVENGYYNPQPVENPDHCGGFKTCPDGKQLNLMTGECDYCPPGKFKVGEHGLCEVWKDCEKMGRHILKVGSKIEDSVCGEIIQPTTVSMNTSLRTAPTPTKVITGASVQDDNSSSSNNLIIIIVVAVAIILLLLIVIACCCCTGRHYSNENNGRCSAKVQNMMNGINDACRRNFSWKSSKTPGNIPQHAQDGNLLQDKRTTGSPPVDLDVEEDGKNHVATISKPSNSVKVEIKINGNGSSDIEVINNGKIDYLHACTSAAETRCLSPQNHTPGKDSDAEFDDDIQYDVISYLESDSGKY